MVMLESVGALIGSLETVRCVAVICRFRQDASILLRRVRSQAFVSDYVERKPQERTFV